MGRSVRLGAGRGAVRLACQGLLRACLGVGMAAAWHGPVWAQLGAQVGAPVAFQPSAQAPAVPGAPAQVQGAGQVVVRGTVPDESTRQAILSRVRAAYGAQRVVDELGVGQVVAPPQWKEHVDRLLQADLKQVSKGQLSIRGNTVELQGEVGNEAVRQQLASNMATSLNPTYTVRNGLQVASRAQDLVDQALANRIVEFEAGSAVITPRGQAIVDEMALALAGLKGKRFEVIGHTDADGHRAGNLALSQQRAQAVKDLLVARQVPADAITTLGAGPDRPVATNATPEGRARNRRIEFRVLP
jgi:OmpA-OmpF porin, OOP family